MHIIRHREPVLLQIHISPRLHRYGSCWDDPLRNFLRLLRKQAYKFPLSNEKGERLRNKRKITVGPQASSVHVLKMCNAPENMHAEILRTNSYFPFVP